MVDSLGGGPLVGAQVSVEGLSGIAIADSLGRFRLDSVPPGRYRIGVFHPLLDSLGLSVASPPMEIAPGAVVSLLMATPSSRALVRLMCEKMPVDSSEGLGPSVVVGRVLDAETDAPVAHAHVSLTWTEFEAGKAVGFRRVQRVRQATTGPTGEFRLCRLPADLAGVVRATSGTSDSSLATRPYETGGRFLSLLVMHVPSAGAAATPRGAAAPSGGTVTGVVMRSDSGGPFAGAEVLVSGSIDTAITDSSGHFALRGLPTGTRTLRVRALGWQPVTMPIEVTLREPRQITVPLAVKTAVLQTVVVTGALKNGLLRVGFAERQRMNVGHFLTPDDIAKKSASELVDLLSSTPGIARVAGADGQDYLRATRGNGCVSYVVDGSPFQEITLGEINNVIAPDQVGAIEIYQPSESPPQYSFETSPVAVAPTPPRAGQGPSMGTPGMASGSNCVRVLIWTKARLGVNK